MKGAWLLAAALTALSAASAWAQPPLYPPPPPAWYTDERVQLHLPLPLHIALRQNQRVRATERLHDKGVSTAAADLGARVMTRHAKSSSEDPWWPSALPVDANGSRILPAPRDNRGVSLGQGANPVARFIADAHGEGFRAIAYYWDSSDTRLATEHPEFGCQTVDGQPLIHPTKGQYLDITGSYGDVVAARLAELQAMGADGIYLDGRHMPPNGCFGTTLAEEYEAATGQAGAENRRAFLAWQATALTDRLHRWTDPLRSSENFAAIVSFTDLAGFLSPAMSLDLARTGIAKTEFRQALLPSVNRMVFARGLPNMPAHLRQKLDLPPEGVLDVGHLVPRPETRIALSWATLRDLSGAPPHVWLFDLADNAALAGAVGAVLSLGGVANLHLAPEVLLNEQTSGPDTTAIRDAFVAGRKAGSVLAGAQADVRVALYLDEDRRNILHGDAEAWLRTVGPLQWAYQTLSEQGIPATIIDKRLLEDGDLSAFDVILVPAPDAGSGDTGPRFTQLPSLLDAIVFSDPKTAFRDALAPVIASDRLSPARPVEPLPAGIHAAFWLAGDENTRLMAITNAFGSIALNQPAAAAAAPLQFRLIDATVPVCLKDALTERDIPVASDGTFWVTNLKSWQLLQWAACAP